MNASGFQEGADSLGNIVKGLGVFKIIEKGFQAIAGAMDSAIARYDTLNKFPQMLEQMGFGAREAGAATDKLSEGIQGLPTTLNDVVSTAQRLTVLTGNLEKSVDTTLALNNAFLASGTSGENAARGAEQYIAMLSTGEVTQMRWRALQETMGYALQKTAEAFGYAGESAQNDLYKALQAGEITFDQFNAKIIELDGAVGGFAELAKTATGGIGTAWTNLKTAIVRETAGIIGAIDEGLSETKFQSIEAVIGTMKDGIIKALRAVADAFGWAARNAEWLVPVLVSIGATVAAWKIGAVIQKVVDGFKAMSAAVTAHMAIERAAAYLGKDRAKTQMALTVLMSNETRAELIRAAAKKAGMTIDANGILITKLGVAATKEEIKQVLASTGALTTKGAVVAVLTGQMGFCTAAVKIFNAAWKANPIGLIVTVIVAAAAAITTLVVVLSKGSKEQQEFAERSKELKKEVDNLTASVKENAKAFEERMASMDATGASATFLIARIWALSEAEGGYAGNLARLNTYIDQFNALVGESVLAYDEKTNSLNMTKEAVEAYIDSLIKQQKTEEMIAQAVELKKKLEEANIKLAETEERIADATVNSAGSFIASMTATHRDIRSKEKLSALIEELTEKYDKLTEATVDYLSTAEGNQQVSSAELRRLEISKEIAAEQARIVARREADEKRLTETMNAEANKQGLTLDEYKTKLKEQEKAWEEHQKAVEKTFNDIANKGAELPTKMKFNLAKLSKVLEDNTAKYAEWKNKIVQLTGSLSEEALAYLTDMGVGSSAIMDEILKDVSGKKAEEFNATIANMWATAGKDGLDAAADAGEAGGAFVDNAADAVESNDSLVDAVEEVTDEVAETFEGLIPQVKSIFHQVMAGAGMALNSKKGWLIGIAKSIAEGITKVLTVAFKISSPSKVTYGIFANVMMGGYNAMKDLSGKLYKKTEDLAHGITDRLSISPEMASNLTAKLRAMVDVNPFNAGSLMPAYAAVGAAGGSTSYVQTFHQTNNSPVPLSPAELTREAQDMLRRGTWQLP